MRAVLLVLLMFLVVPTAVGATDDPESAIGSEAAKNPAPAKTIQPPDAEALEILQMRELLELLELLEDMDVLTRMEEKE